MDALLSLYYYSRQKNRISFTWSEECRHRRRSRWTSGGGTHGERRRWVRVDWGGIWGGVSPLQPTKGSGGVVSYPSGVRGGAPAENAILAYFEGHRTLFFCTYMTKSGGGQFVLASPAPNSGGGTCLPCPPRDLRPCLQFKQYWATKEQKTRYKPFCFS